MKIYMDKIITTGRIDKKIYGDTGNVMYYVTVDVNGEQVRAQSVHYSSKTKSLMEGKDVTVIFYETAKGNKICKILNEDIVSCEDEVKKSLPFTMVCIAIIIVVIILWAIKT